MTTPWGTYVHVPWCRVRCPYCAFDILPKVSPDEPAWVAGVLADLARWHSKFPGTSSTLYFGGGTPSRLSVDAISQVIQAVGAAHVTLEANPEDLSQAWLDGVIEAGVHRISLGVQSTVARFARQLGRAHVPPEAAVERLRSSSLESWSLDLIFGLADQTETDLRADLDTLLGWSPPHVSLYGLTIEPNTAFARLEARGRTMEAEPDVWRAMYDLLVDTLHAHGLERYEVSNFARTGHRSKHNVLYWTGAPYLGAGPSAHGFAPDGARWVNPSFQEWRNHQPPTIEHPDPEQAAIDRLISGLRGVEGIPVDALGSYTVEARTRQQLEDNGLLVPNPRLLQLTHAGFPVSDAVTRALACALHTTIG